MLFSSLTFLFLFLPVLLCLYFISKEKYRNYILLIASLLFYAWGEPKYIVLMIVSILVNYILAILIDRYRKRSFLPKFILSVSIIFNLFFLFVFKYFDFVIGNINNIFNTSFKLYNLSLPIGISFYTFQVLSYVIDVYRKDVKVQKNVLTLGTYVALFPQLIAGPIVRYSTIEKELQNRKITIDKIINGVKRFIVGLSKKVIIANNMALIADTIFNSSHILEYSWISLLIALVAYTFQIYFDFSGYSDMAIGLGEMFGFTFLENFDYPYISTSITDFWRRWHISLSTWFRDYIYIPLGGNRVSKSRWIFNMLIVWLFTGLWHGASWNFIIWGLYYFSILILEKLLLHKLLIKLPKLLQWIYAFALINIGWLIFRIEDINLLGNVMLNLFTFKSNNFVSDLILNYELLNCSIYFIFAIVFSFPIIKILDNKIENKTLKIVLSNVSLILLFIFCIILLINSSYNPFIYFRF